MKNNQQPKGISHQPILWGILHGFNDFAAGFMLANFTYNHPSSQAVLYIVLYSILAFGGQLPVGIWLDNKKQIRPFARALIILLPLSIIVFFVDAKLGIMISGIASALVHVTGGAICLQVNENKIGPLGLFTAPGVFGLTLGGLLGQFNQWPLAGIGIGVLCISYLIFKNGLPIYQSQAKKESELDSHDFIMLALLLFMCFRSFIFDVINYVAQEHTDGILVIGISVFLGKILGGFIADKIGWKKYVFITLPLAFLFLQFGKQNIYALSFGMACMQSSVPITLLLMGRFLPLYPATATALSLGVSIAMAGLPLFLISDKKNITIYFYHPIITAVFFIALLLGGYIWLKKMNRLKATIEV